MIWNNPTSQWNKPPYFYGGIPTFFEPVSSLVSPREGVGSNISNINNILFEIITEKKY